MRFQAMVFFSIRPSISLVVDGEIDGRGGGSDVYTQTKEEVKKSVISERKKNDVRPTEENLLFSLPELDW